MDTVQKWLKKPLTSIVISIVLGFVVGAVVLSVAGYNPLEAYAAMFRGIFSKPKYMAQVVIKSTPLILTGLSVAFAFKTGLFNIGAEGQYIIGSVAAVLVGAKLSLPPVLHFLAVVLAAMVAAGRWGCFAGFLKAKFGINEVITCIMLNWIALYFNNFMIQMPWLKKPGAEASYEVQRSAWSMVLGNYKATEEGRQALLANPTLADVVLKTDLNYGILFAILAALLVWFVLNRTCKGFELRSVGFNSDAARFAGINVNRNIMHSMFIAGALAGLAGALQMTGVMPHRISMLAAQEGYGFDGISVALIANSSPIGCIFSGLLFGGLKYGGSAIQSTTGAPSEVINIVIGTIVFFIAMSTMFRVLADKLAKRGGKRHASHTDSGN